MSLLYALDQNSGHFRQRQFLITVLMFYCLALESGCETCFFRFPVQVVPKQMIHQLIM